MQQTPDTVYADLRGQTVVITGGARASATPPPRPRAPGRAWLLDMDEAALAVAVAGLQAEGGEALACQASVTDADAVERAFAQVEQAWGRIDVLVNNAGISANKPTLEVSAEEWRRAVDINLTGVFLCAQAAGRRMPAGAGCIINLASMYGVVAAPDRAAYCATKGAVVLLTETLAVEWGRWACA